MATQDECQAALEELAGMLGDHGEHAKAFPDRTLSCTIPDLALTFSGAIRDGELLDITTDPAPRAQIRLTVHSDDLIALVNRELKVGKAFRNGQLKVDASFSDLMRLRSLG